MTPRIPGAKQTEITGAMLAEEINAALKANPELCRWKVATLVYNRKGGIKQLATVKYPTPAIIARVRGILANPPREAFRSEIYGRPADPGRPRYASGRIKYQQQYTPRPRTYSEVRGQRIAAAVRRRSNKRAMARIEAGLSAQTASASIKLTQQAIEKQLAYAASLKCPVEQAKRALRKLYTPVVCASVMGGQKGNYVVGKRTITEAELLAMAERLAA